jgi:hypothetical protein
VGATHALSALASARVGELYQCRLASNATHVRSSTIGQFDAIRDSARWIEINSKLNQWIEEVTASGP